ncbi:MAG: ABC transporter ATP-binding protein, partial [Actinomycetaceae bacterium]|nr:ABC transporter ATP-binding protein [Actinomycetaceae bacterium]
DIIHTYSMKDSINKEFHRSNNELFRTSYKAHTYSQMAMPVMNFASNLAFILLCVWGGLSVLSSTLTIGALQALLQYSRQLSNPIQTLSSMASTLQSGAASSKRIFEFLDQDEEIEENESRQIARKETPYFVEFDNVSFGYEKNSAVINNFSLKVKKGDKVAIVGHTGAGKTTLVNLLMRFYDLDKGHIYIDGYDIHQLKRSRLRSYFSIVLQDPWLHNGTIADNIAFGLPQASREDVYKAAHACSIDHIIRQLPQGYDTVLQNNAHILSAGERQLISIARAYIAHSDILILDEATSAIDTHTEILVQKALQTLTTSTTSFIIAHRLSTIRDADVIIMMDKGEILETGTHEELMKKNGHYTRLYNAQYDSFQ